MGGLMKLAPLLLMTFYFSSAEDTGALKVLYTHRTIAASRGSSVSLSSETHYDVHRCGRVNVVWSQDSKMLTDPSRYFTTVKESVFNGTMRSRWVTTEILHLTSEDEGVFQCQAECESGEAAMGHFIVIKLKG